jgi:cytochrome c peroxidase
MFYKKQDQKTKASASLYFFTLGKRLSSTGAFLVLTLGAQASAATLTPIELLGKHIFFDEKLSMPPKQSCASCHDPARGWILPNSAINSSTVVAPGARPHALGNIKPPSNAYASFSPPFRFKDFDSFLPPWEGGNFWDGRAEGCGATAGPCPAASPAGAVSETITVEDLPVSRQAEYQKYLGPTAEQALNPFPNPVEQNIRAQHVCLRVMTAPYKDLYEQAFDEAINCIPIPRGEPAYQTSYKRLAVALAAWQASKDVNSFSSKRDKALEAEKQFETPPRFPLRELTPEENLGHDLFYSTAFGGPNGGPRLVGAARVPANCVVCHNNGGAGSDGTEPQQLYTDHRYHHIGVPFNREIPGVAEGEKTGLSAHVADVPPGHFRTPTLRNVAKGVSGNFKKAYTHNGWFKNLSTLAHFYNTRDVLPLCESLGILQATEEEALQHNCWPAPEFDNAAMEGFPIIGNLGLTPEEEAALGAYLKTFTDEHTPTRP